MKNLMIGHVVSVSSKKTCKVLVKILRKHSFYPKYVLHRKNYISHDPHSVAVIGLEVHLKPIAKQSKLKAFEIVPVCAGGAV
jgi:ribosomal protein S17